MYADKIHFCILNYDGNTCTNRADRMSKVNVLTVHIILAALCHPVCVFFSCLLQRSHFSTMAQSSKVYDGIPRVGKRVRKVITFMTRIRS